MPIYLDYNATTPIDPRVAEAMLPFVQRCYGNPSSGHAMGQEAAAAVAKGRKNVADLIGAAPKEIVFTGGGTEASNLAIKGVVFAKLHGIFGRWAKGAHIITSAIEHPATCQPCQFLKRLGCTITILPVDQFGLVHPDDVKKAITKSTTLVSIMHSNNEVGTIEPIAEIAKICKEYGALIHTDVAQSLGKVAIDVNELGVDLLSIAGHKLYAPKGVGALYVRSGVKLEPLVHGAGHEEGRRAGTENVPYIAALGEACAIAKGSLPDATEKLRGRRERFWIGLKETFGEDVSLNGHPDHRLPNTLNVSFHGHIGSELLEKVPDVAASTGSACHEGRISTSPVLQAMGTPKKIAQGAVRLSVGRFTTDEEIDQALTAFRQALVPA